LFQVSQLPRDDFMTQGRADGGSLCLIPFVGAVILIILLALKGEAGPNKYGQPVMAGGDAPTGASEPTGPPAATEPATESAPTIEASSQTEVASSGPTEEEKQ